MIKLTNIINELGINKYPSKKEILNHMIYTAPGDEVSLLDKCMFQDTFEDYLEEWGDVDDTFENYDEDTKYVYYYKLFSVKDIYIFEVEDSDAESRIAFSVPYKYCIHWGKGYNNSLIIMHNID